MKKSFGKANQHYVTRYHRFIESRSKRTLNEGQYVEKHHIIPKCMGGDDKPANLIVLSLREHFIAHMLLAYAYPNYIPVCSAFIQMCHKNKHKDDAYVEKIQNSKMYESLKTNFYNQLSESRKNIVYCKDENGNTVRITSEEYKSGKYISHADGMVYCKGPDGVPVYITSDEYKTGKYTFHTSGMVYCWDSDGNPAYVSSEEYQRGEYNIDNRILDSKILISDAISGDQFYMKYSDWLNDPRRDETYYDKVSNKKRFKCTNRIPKDLTNSILASQNKITCFDLETKKNVKIPVDEYYQNRHKYKANTEGMYVAKDEHGNSVLAEYGSGLPGITKGYTTVLEKSTQKYVTIPHDEYKENKQLYQGPCEGKRNVRSIYEVGYYQISREKYDYEVGPNNIIWVHNPSTGEEKQITKNEYVNKDWKVGKFGKVKKPEGCLKVFNKETNEYMYVAEEEYLKNKHLYSSAVTGRRTLRSIHIAGYYSVCRDKLEHEVGAGKSHWVHNPLTGEEKQITKDEFVDFDWKVGRVDM